MAYTAVEFQPTLGMPLVAIYKEQETGARRAEIVLAFAIYRNPDDRGCENVLVPMHVFDFVHTQSHYFPNRRLLNERLPFAIYVDAELYDAVALHAVEHSNNPATVERVNGQWVVVE